MDLTQRIEIKTHFQRLFTLTTNGELQIWKINANYELFTLQNQDNEGNDHDLRIISFDLMPSKKIVLTGGED